MTAGDFPLVTDAVVVHIEQTVAVAIVAQHLVRARTVAVRCVGVVVARHWILATRNFLHVTHRIRIDVAVHNGAGAVRCARTKITARRIDAGHAAVRRAGVVVAGRGVLAARDFVGVAHAVVVGVVVNRGARAVSRARARFTSNREGA